MNSFLDSLPVQQDANTRISVDRPPIEPNFPTIGKSLYFFPHCSGSIVYKLKSIQNLNFRLGIVHSFYPRSKETLNFFHSFYWIHLKKELLWDNAMKCGKGSKAKVGRSEACWWKNGKFLITPSYFWAQFWKNNSFKNQNKQLNLFSFRIWYLSTSIIPLLGFS